MILKNNQTIGKVYKGTTEIAKIYKGSTLVYQSIKDMIARGVNFVLIHKAKANSLEYLKTFGKCEQSSTPTPDNPISIICNNGELKVRNKSGLPWGYQAIEYLQSDGACYIDLLRVPNNTDIIEQKFQKLGNGTTTCSWYGSMPSSSTTKPRIGLGSYMSGMFCGINSTINLANISTQAHTIKFQAISNQKIEYTYDGVTAVAAVPGGDSAYTPAINLTSYLFARHGTSGVQTYDNEGTRIFYHKEYLQDGTIQLDLIPCRRKTDNVLGMYDLVADTFHTNQGTGTFIAGSDIDDIEVYADGTEEKVEIHGKNLFDYSARTIGYSMNEDGSLFGAGADDVSDFIAVKPNTTYYCSRAGSRRGKFFDINKQPIQTSGFDFTLLNSGTSFVTNSSTYYVRFAMSGTVVDRTKIQFELGSTATTYEPYFDGGTATCENLLSVGDYQDIQEVISGDVTRNVSIKVLDGTENWLKSSSNAFYLSNVIIDYSRTRFIPFCTHFKGQESTTLGSSQVQDLCVCFFAGTGLTKESYIRYNAITTVEQFKQWLADQYNAGTPVIIVYLLATATTETVTTQPMNIQEGTNTIEVTDASLNDLELEIKYKGK